ncbi:MAG: Hpt domain-containing protein [Bacteroidia bacterium]
MSERLYDLATLKDIGGDDPAFMKEMVEMFATITPDTLIDIKQAIQTENWQQVGSIAHSLKANLISYGISGMKEIILQLESCSSNEHPRAFALDNFAILEDVCSRAIQQMLEDYMLK